ncbi:hypothetical protein MRBLPD1_002549 [Pseudomonas brassicacearum]|uniref:hypothetical protein n=1 Tax=Pseudomonas brassicacearum TaxID=930166 RepID=UPI003465EA43
MPEITLTTADTSGWTNCVRRDLPERSISRLIPDGERSNRPLEPPGALDGNYWKSSGVPAIRNLHYTYVDTMFSRVEQNDVLWSDSASWCTMLSVWSPGKAGLAHIPPSPLVREEVDKLLESFHTIPTEIHMVTMPVHRDRADGFAMVRQCVMSYYGHNYAGIKVFLITGYKGKEWEQRHQIGVDPRSGAFPVFN